jgi:Fe-S-cluster containining protein
MSFSNTESQSRDDKVFRSPASWDLEALQQNWLEQLQVLAEENEISVPLERLRVQVEQTPVYQEVFQRWDKMDGLTRLQSWKRLLDASEKQMGDILPSCLQCGDCCRRGSPSLHVEDMELLHEGKIPWSRLVTLRRGEPVRSPYNGKVFHLMDERIKLAEKPGTRECVFLDEADNQCTIYSIRPVQCRAQACWDPKQAQQLAEQPYLTRRDVFKQIELLLELIAKHDEQCAFSKLGEAFERLKQSGVTELYYLPGDSLLGDDGEATTDGSHPNDLGMVRYADAYEEVLRTVLQE